MARDGWPPKRLARFGYLVGIGMGSLEIAEELGLSQERVWKAAERMGLKLHPKREGTVEAHVSVPFKVREHIDKCAKARGLGRSEFLRLLLHSIAEDGTDFIDNLIDDDVYAAAVTSRGA